MRGCSRGGFAKPHRRDAALRACRHAGRKTLLALQKGTASRPTNPEAGLEWVCEREREQGQDRRCRAPVVSRLPRCAAVIGVADGPPDRYYLGRAELLHLVLLLSVLVRARRGGAFRLVVLHRPLLGAEPRGAALQALGRSLRGRRGALRDGGPRYFGRRLPDGLLRPLSPLHLRRVPLRARAVRFGGSLGRRPEACRSSCPVRLRQARAARRGGGLDVSARGARAVPDARPRRSGTDGTGRSGPRAGVRDQAQRLPPGAGGALVGGGLQVGTENLRAAIRELRYRGGCVLRDLAVALARPCGEDVGVPDVDGGPAGGAVRLLPRGLVGRGALPLPSRSSSWCRSR